MQGGVTKSQALFLFEEADKEKYQDFKFMAALHGVDLDKPSKGSAVSTTSVTEDEFAFKDPSEYEHMTDEERKKETEKMMKHWKMFTMKGFSGR